MKNLKVDEKMPKKKSGSLSINPGQTWCDQACLDSIFVAILSRNCHEKYSDLKKIFWILKPYHSIVPEVEIRWFSAKKPWELANQRLESLSRSALLTENYVLRQVSIMSTVKFYKFFDSWNFL